jgi:RNA polymerase sigma factor (sigma-70 family)
MEALSLAPPVREGAQNSSHARPDEEAFGLLYERHRGELERFCGWLLGSPHEAEDAVQQTFVSAYAALSRASSPTQPRAWLYAIARNRCLALLRGRRFDPPAPYEPTTIDCLTVVELRESMRELVDDVAGLPNPQRTALVMSEVGELSHADIARVLGCEPAQVKSLVFRARAALRQRREAREMPCESVRDQLSSVRRGGFRRSTLRLHLQACPHCAEFREQLKQSRGIAALLPLGPAALTRPLRRLGLVGGWAGGGAGIGSSALVVKSAAVIAALVGASLAVGGGLPKPLVQSGVTEAHLYVRHQTTVPALVPRARLAAIPMLARSPAALSPGTELGAQRLATDDRSPSRGDAPSADGGADEPLDSPGGSIGPSPSTASPDPAARGESQKRAHSRASPGDDPGPRPGNGRGVRGDDHRGDRRARRDAAEAPRPRKSEFELPLPPPSQFEPPGQLTLRDERSRRRGAGTPPAASDH